MTSSEGCLHRPSSRWSQMVSNLPEHRGSSPRGPCMPRRVPSWLGVKPAASGGAVSSSSVPTTPSSSPTSPRPGLQQRTAGRKQPVAPRPPAPHQDALAVCYWTVSGPLKVRLGSTCEPPWRPARAVGMVWTVLLVHTTPPCPGAAAPRETPLPTCHHFSQDIFRAGRLRVPSPARLRLS